MYLRTHLRFPISDNWNALVKHDLETKHSFNSKYSKNVS